MFQFRRFPRYTYFEFQCNVPEYEPRWVSSFRNLRINAYLQLPEAFRSLSRLSSAPSAKAFALRPCSLDHIKLISFEIGLYPLDSLLPTKIIVTLPFEIVIFLKKELTIIFVSQLLFSFQGTSLVMFPQSPVSCNSDSSSHGGPKWTRTIDLTIISRVL